MLIGPAIEALPYFIHIFIEIGRRGLGRERGIYELTRVDLLQDRATIPVYEASSRTVSAFRPEAGPASLPEDDRAASLTLQFLTPLRLKEKGDLVARLTFHRFFTALARRLSLLWAFYGSNGAGGSGGSKTEFAPVSPEVGLLAEKAADICVFKNDLHWHDWERYSRRQDTTMKFGGLMGHITFRGELGPFMPFLRLGEAVNVGQATTFGLGKYQIII